MTKILITLLVNDNLNLKGDEKLKIPEDKETETGLTKPWGVIHCPVTPMHEDREIDYKKLKDFVSFGVDADVDGVMSCATTAENASLTKEEWKKVTKTTVEETKNLPVFCHVAQQSLGKTIDRAKYAEEIGADGVIVSNPYWWLYDEYQENLIRFYKRLSEELDIGISIYNYPQRTQNNLDPGSLIKIVDDEGVDNIVGIKDSNSDSHELMAKLRLVGNHPQFNFGVGANMMFPFCLAGLNLAWMVSTNLNPDLMVNLWKACRENNWEEAKDLQFKASKLLGLVWGQDYPAGIKTCLELLGRSAGPPRSPIYPMDEKRREWMKGKLIKLGYDVKED